MSKLTKFQNKIDNGEITDFRPYLTVKPASIQVEMAKRGILVDELAKQDNPAVRIALIQNGHCPEYYAEWATSTKDVRIVLAKAGYCHEQLIKDKHWEVRVAVMETNPVYMAQRVHSQSGHELHHMMRILGQQLQPDWDLVAAIINNKNSHNYPQSYKGSWYLRASNYELISENVRYVEMLKNKYASRNMAVDSIERTMTPWQLFTANRKAWETSVSGTAAYNILKCEDILRNEARGEEWFHRIVNGEIDFARVKFEHGNDKAKR